MNTTKTNLSKILAITGYSILVIVLTILLITPAASEYEISIYNVFPFIFWILIIICIFIGQLIILENIYSKTEKNTWVYGFLLILLTNAILLFMPIIRGYFTFGKWDELVYAGYTKIIINTGHIGVNNLNTNYYPIDHILNAVTNLVAGISVPYNLMLIPAIISLFFLFSFYLLAKQISNEKRMILFILIFTSIIYYTHEALTFSPSAQSFALIPFFLYLYYRSRRNIYAIEFSFLLVLMTFLMVFYHPVTVLFLIALFFVLELSTYLYTLFKKDKIKFKLPQRNNYGIITLLIVSFLTWYLSFTRSAADLRIISDWLTKAAGGTEVQTYSGLIMKAGVTLTDLINIILNTYGQTVILGLILMVFSLFILYNRKNLLKNNMINKNYLIFPLVSIAFLLISIMFFFNQFIIGFNRVLIYFILFSSIFAGIGFYLYTLKIKKLNYKSFLMISVILLLLTYFSIFNVYWSPIVKKENQQVTLSDVDGMKWIFDNENSSYQIKSLGIAQLNYFNFINENYTNYINFTGYQTDPPEHFGYSNNTLLGDNYTAPTYLFVTILGKISYPKIYPEYPNQWKFTPLDFDFLQNNDTTSSQIYSSGENEIYIVKPNK